MAKQALAYEEPDLNLSGNGLQLLQNVPDGLRRAFLQSAVLNSGDCGERESNSD